MDDKPLDTDKARYEAFVEGFKELSKRTQYNIGCSPNFVATERGTFEIAIDMRPVDIKDASVPSPFVV